MKVLFVGLGKSAVCWYRCALPAMFLRDAGWDADWIGLAGEPPTMLMQTGVVDPSRRVENGQFPRLNAYDVVVLQQPRGTGWLRVIRRLQSEGVKVLYEIDDYLHGIRNLASHDYKRHFGKQELERLELTMRVCDGVICSTEYIARRYRKFNRRTWVCRNGIDLGRYDLTRPPRPTVNVGWSGATGHQEAVAPWIAATGRVMGRHPHVCFVSIGMNFADALRPHFPSRCIAIPFTMIDTYPSAMTMFDVALAPAGRGAFYAGKSDLRWLEAGALGIPVIADPGVYPDIEHGITGFHAASIEEVEGLLDELVVNDELRIEVGGNARTVVRSSRSMATLSSRWADVLVEVTSRSATERAS